MKKVIIIFSLMVLTFSSWANPSIDNVDFKFNGQQLVITYDINNASREATFSIVVTILSETGKIGAKTFTGDIGENITAGKGKAIMWQAKADNIAISSNIYVIVSATEKLNISVTEHVSKSLLFSGLGNYRLDNRKLHFLYGVAAYGSLTAGIALNYAAFNNYESYLGSNDFASSNNYFELAKKQKVQSLAFVGTSIGIWTYSAINTYIKTNNLKKYKNITSDISRFYSNKSAQFISGKSPEKFLEIKEVFFPPNLVFDLDHDIKFFNTNRDEIYFLDADTKGTMRFKIFNSGLGDALGVKVYLNTKNQIYGLSIPMEIFIGKIEKGETKEIEIPYETSINLSAGKASIEFEILEQNDFGLLPILKEVITRKFVEPKVQVMDFTITTEKGGIPSKNEKIYFDAMIQNVGFGDAKNIKIDFLVSDPNLIINLSENTSIELPVLAAGKGLALNQVFLVKPRYSDSSFKVNITISEFYNKYGCKKDVPISLKQELQKKLIVYNDFGNQIEIKPMSLTSDVDINIPEGIVINPNRYALVIGNEDYKSRQPNLQIESNVDFAINDARVFKEYLNRSLGFKSDNIKYLTNATAGEMKTEINRLVTLFSKIPNPEKAEIIFYYAGHGYPDQETQVPYLMPVDVSANDLSAAIKVNELFEQLAKTNSGKITIFLDACFSGGGRTEGLIAARGARIKPQPKSIKGNIVVFSASSGTQTALPYKEQKHGYFTYFLLKKIQLSKGDVTYAEMEKYLKENVGVETTKSLRPQDPEVNVSPELNDIWKKWTFK